MADVLSQSEIDDLLRAMTSGNTEQITIDTSASKAKKARNYDFARPSKINKEQLRTIWLIFDTYSRLISSFLTGYLRTSTHVEVINAEQMLYNEFNNSLVNPVILGMVELKPLKGTAIFELSSNVGYAILDRILGGPGLNLNLDRDFSEIEKILLERVMSQMINLLVEPWINVLELNPILDKIETNSQFAQIIAPNEITALVTLTIKIGSSEGFVNFCVPHKVIEPIIERLNTKYWFTKQEDENKHEHKEDLEKNLSDTLIPISAIIGKTTITVNDFVHLQKGDIITLDSFIDSDLSIMVGDLLKFNAKPGINRGRNAVQITQIIKKEGD